MARPIFLDKEMQMSILRDIAKQLSGVRATGTTLKVEKKLSYDDDRKATIVYTKEAWFKTVMLIATQSKEVGWYGVVKRDEEDPSVFHISDILLYPQEVTGATVEAKDAEYVAWLDTLDDESFNHRRAFIHSHVNMATSPSGKDEEVWANKLTQVKNDDFYIFQIMNKSGQIYSRVYDFKENTIYDPDDVQTQVECSDMKIWDTYKYIANVLLGCDMSIVGEAIDLFQSAGIAEMVEDAKEKVTTAAPTYSKNTTYGWPNGGVYYNGVYNGQNVGSGYKDYRNTGDGKVGKVTKLDKTSKKPTLTEDGYRDFYSLEPDEQDSLIERFGEDLAVKWGEQLLDPLFYTD